MIGFHCSHELYSPRELLELADLATRAGFSHVSCSDHFSPWSVYGHSGFAWSWLGAALEHCPGEFGTVCAPGQRYHPAIVAQAAATLAQMYPNRFWLAVGTGENLNEHITGDEWPAKRIRQERLAECVTVLRQLWAGETVDRQGLIRVDNARLYTLPEQAPQLYGAAITDATAQWVGAWGDGLLTVAKPPQDLAKTIDAFRRGGGQGKPMRLQAAISLAKTDEIAEVAAYRHWGVACVESEEMQDIASPELFDAKVASHGPDEVCDKLRVSADLDEHREWIRRDLELGFEVVYLHYVGHDICRFIEVFGQEVLPKFQ